MLTFTGIIEMKLIRWKYTKKKMTSKLKKTTSRPNYILMLLKQYKHKMGRVPKVKQLHLSYQN
jgi:hypothetical protein